MVSNLILIIKIGWIQNNLEVAKNAWKVYSEEGGFMKELLFDRLHRGLGNVLDLRQKQNVLTAGNIANADTPHYKAKFIRFDELLSQAVGNEDFSLRQTNSRHLSGFSGTADDPVVTEIDPAPWVLDGNSVQLEREQVRLKSNALQYNAVVKGLSKRLSILRYVASNGRG